MRPDQRADHAHAQQSRSHDLGDEPEARQRHGSEPRPAAPADHRGPTAELALAIPQRATAAGHAPARLRNAIRRLARESDINASPLDLPSSGAGFKTVCADLRQLFSDQLRHRRLALRRDERTCKRLCPAADVVLHAPQSRRGDRAGGINQRPAVYGYRRLQIPADTIRLARAARQASWADALGVGRDATVQQGDIVVTEPRETIGAAARGQTSPSVAARRTHSLPAPAGRRPARRGTAGPTGSSGAGRAQGHTGRPAILSVR